ncbi:hypothetical protein QBC35DRAFT_547595 [Podospora australis]|uniref:Uncharacterized protein n=1 Tax=Podospora australis TaxID=1536484 RepID=A0AAN6WVI4_9PEZI|nr:hypothetical protein QBC35DRAFT_547595 [Podospora australis]
MALPGFQRLAGLLVPGGSVTAASKARRVPLSKTWGPYQPTTVLEAGDDLKARLEPLAAWKSFDGLQIGLRAAVDDRILQPRTSWALRAEDFSITPIPAAGSSTRNQSETSPSNLGAVEVPTPITISGGGFLVSSWPSSLAALLLRVGHDHLIPSEWLSVRPRTALAPFSPSTGSLVVSRAEHHTFSLSIRSRFCLGGYFVRSEQVRESQYWAVLSAQLIRW